ncbi:SP_1767 family glycosyltransferase [Kaistella sp. G5-32]|uniref:SP_1767 family glycosyltransferase n=1 Tax=Kaistella gelatinilytica TaxID=2787636 RepID=A0ABS0FC94_9FLAO|nr:SP_1767 family glycosyltransferase [Kaistella gelatinilytica]MBF8457262.1 SP_1767 family glycosyltransferase [Kaistella gelatinilytica]
MIRIKKNLYYYFWLCRSYKLRRKFPAFDILNTSETISHIIKNRKSISRFGDGEFRLLLQERDIYFQALTIDLALRLREVLASNVPNLLIAIPGTFTSVKNIKHASKVHWINFINLYGEKLTPYLRLDKTYGDSLISRFYMDCKNKSKVENTVQQLKRIWESEDVLFVEGELSRLGIGNDLFNNAKSVERIICPSENAYASYEEILHNVKKFGKSKLIILALGPTATILAHDLAKENFWALDLGHIDIEYLWYKMKATEKIPVGNKKSAEVSEDSNFELSESENITYQTSIIFKIR